MVRLLMEADAQTVWDQITTHLRNGNSLRSLGDAIQVGAAELILRTTVPRKFTEGQHPFDYCNTANYWMRTQRQSVSAAHPVSDGQLRERRGARQQAVQLGDRAGVRRASTLSGRTPETLLREQDEAIMAFDFARATAVAQCLSAIRRGSQRRCWPASRSPRASSRTIRTTRRSAIRRSRSTGTIRPICATGCCWPPRGCSPAGRRCRASAIATPAT